MQITPNYVNGYIPPGEEEKICVLVIWMNQPFILSSTVFPVPAALTKQTACMRSAAHNLSFPHLSVCFQFPTSYLYF